MPRVYRRYTKSPLVGKHTMVELLTTATLGDLKAVVNEVGPTLRRLPLKHSAVGLGTIDTLTPDEGTSGGPTSLHNATFRFWCKVTQPHIAAHVPHPFLRFREAP